MNIQQNFAFFTGSTAISYGAYYLRTNNYVAGLTAELLAIPEAVGHFIGSELFIHGIKHSIEYQGIAAGINYVIPSGGTGVALSSITNFAFEKIEICFAPINNFIERIDVDASKEVALFFYINNLLQEQNFCDDRKESYICKVNNHFIEWQENATKGTIVGKYYEYIKDVWNIVHPWHHFSEVQETLIQNTPIQNIIGKTLLFSRFYINEKDEMIESFDHLYQGIAKGLTHLSQSISDRLPSFDEIGSNNLTYRDENQTCYVDNPYKNYITSDCNNNLYWDDFYIDDNEMAYITRSGTPYNDLIFKNDIITSSDDLSTVGVVSVHTEL